MSRTHPSIPLAALIASTALLVSCSDHGDPAGLEPDDPNLAVGTTLLECPVQYERSTSATLGLRGGTVQLQKHLMAVPLFAVSRSTEFTVAAPASALMEVEISPQGGGSYQFSRPVTITIDYSRCPRSLTDKRPLTVWQIDGETKELIEHMGGVDDKVGRTITFESQHLSHFSIAQ